MFLQFCLFQLHRPDLIPHISDYQPQNKQLGNPYIGIVIDQHLKTTSGIHLPEHIAGHSQNSRKGGLLLPIDNGKQQHVQQKRIQIGKILASYCPVIHHKKRNETNHVFKKRE